MPTGRPEVGSIAPGICVSSISEGLEGAVIALQVWRLLERRRCGQGGRTPNFGHARVRGSAMRIRNDFGTLASPPVIVTGALFRGPSVARLLKGVSSLVTPPRVPWGWFFPQASERAPVAATPTAYEWWKSSSLRPLGVCAKAAVRRRFLLPSRSLVRRTSARGRHISKRPSWARSPNRGEATAL